MKQSIFAKDSAKIANATEEVLNNLLGKYMHLGAKQDKVIANIELMLESAKNNKARIKEVIQKCNIASMQYNTKVMYNVKGTRMMIDSENYDLYLKDGYVDGEVFIFKKVGKKSTLKDTLSIGDFQLQHQEQLAPMYQLTKLEKSTYFMIGHKNRVMELIQENNVSVTV